MIRAASPSGAEHVVWSRQLLNPVAPEHAVLSADGRAVATFDEWCSSPGTVVLYDSAGSVIAVNSLLDFLLPSEIAKLGESMAGFEWFDSARFDEEARVLRLDVRQGKGNAKEARVLEPIRIDLDAQSGRAMRPQREISEIRKSIDACRSLRPRAGDFSWDRCESLGYSEPWCSACLFYEFP